MKSTQADREIVKTNDGLYVGSLTDDEIESFDRCVADNLASRQYSGDITPFGLAKVKYLGE